MLKDSEIWIRNFLLFLEKYWICAYEILFFFLNKIFMGEISSHVNFVLILSSGNNTVIFFRAKKSLFKHLKMYNNCISFHKRFKNLSNVFNDTMNVDQELFQLSSID